MASMKIAVLCLAVVIATTDASVFNPNFFPGITHGYNQLIGYNVPVGCPRGYCRSSFNNQYYCCNTGGIGGGLSVGGLGVGFNAAHYPGLLPQFSSHIYNYIPNQCPRTYCRSAYDSRYYCCTTAQQRLQQNILAQNQLNSGGILVTDPYYNPHALG